MKYLLFFASLVLAALSNTASAQVKVAIDDAWARSTVTTQKASGVFMKLRADQNAKLVAAKSPVAGVVEVHEMKTVDGVMRMNAINSLELPKDKTVELGPGGYHIMLMDLKEQLKLGEQIDLTLVIEDINQKKSEMTIKVPIHSFTSRKASQEKTKQ
jgi:periplasmic copper chaperone A